MTRRYHHLYGPVPSRRLGRSLGVDLVPFKVCTYDCIYCQIGKTTDKTLFRKEYVPVEEILEELKLFFERGGSPADHVSLGGSGEPTLHSGLGSIIKGIKAITSVPVAVITNGALLSDEEVRKDLLDADVVLPSLDAASPEVFARINRPRNDFSVEQMIEGLVEFRTLYRGQIWLEVLFCKGVNDAPGEILRMKEALGRIQPDQIHLNTVVRPPAEMSAKPLTQGKMEEIRTFFGEKASIISEFDRHLSGPPEEEVTERVLAILRRRPLSLSDLTKMIGVSEEEVSASMASLIAKGKVRIRLVEDSTFYETSEDANPSDRS